MEGALGIRLEVRYKAIGKCKRKINDGNLKWNGERAGFHPAQASLQVTIFAILQYSAHLELRLWHDKRMKELDNVRVTQFFGLECLL